MDDRPTFVSQCPDAYINTHGDCMRSDYFWAMVAVIFILAVLLRAVCRK